jgi:hypothetical protein
MQCKRKKRDGKRCGAPALTDKAYCALHAEVGRAAAYYPAETSRTVRAGRCRRLQCQTSCETERPNGRLRRFHPSPANAVGE